MYRKNAKLKIRMWFLVTVLLGIAFSYSYADEKPVDSNIPQDGIYTVNVALWHQVMDKPSMGNKGLVQQAEVQVKDGKLTMFLETRIIQVTGITASLVSFFYFDDKKQDFTKAEARAYTFEIDGQKRPRIFIFPIKYGQEFSRVLVDPKVEVMGDKPIEARLKVDWSSFSKIEKSTKQEIIDKTAESDIEAKIQLKKLEETMALGSNTDSSKEKHKLMEIKPVGNIVLPAAGGPISDVNEVQQISPIPEEDFTGTGDDGSIQNNETDKVSQSDKSKNLKPKERKSIIFGILFFIVAMVGISVSVMVTYLKKIGRENRRAAELDIFEGDLQI